MGPDSLRSSSVTAKQKAGAISCMEKIDVSAGDVIIKQGDAGDKFYIVDSGTYDVGVRNEDGVVMTVLTYENPGSAFGELSLMYGKPRAATVTATSGGQLWAINRCVVRRAKHGERSAASEASREERVLC